MALFHVQVEPHSGLFQPESEMKPFIHNTTSFLLPHSTFSSQTVVLFYSDRFRVQNLLYGQHNEDTIACVVGVVVMFLVAI